MNPAAVLSVVVKATGVAQANKALMSTNAELKATEAQSVAASKGMTRVGASGKKAAGGLLSTAKAAGGLVAAYAGIKGIEKSIHTTEDLGKTTLNLARNFGFATHEASQWAAVMQARGTESKQLAMGFKTLATQIRGAGAGSKASVKIFKDLGISQRDLVQHGDDLNYMLGRVSDGLGKLPGGVSKAAIQSRLFGRAWLQLSPVLRDGSAALQDNLHMADEYGATLGGKTVAQIQESIKAQREAKLASMGLQVTLGTTLIPVLDRLIVTFAETVKNFREGTGAAGQIRDAFVRVGAVLAPFGQSIAQIVGWLQKHDEAARVLIAGLGGLAVAIWAVNTALAANPFVLAVVGIAAFTVAIVTAYRESTIFRNIVDAVWSALRSAALAASGAVVASMNAIAGAFRTTTAAISHEVGSWRVLFAAVNLMFSGMLAAARLMFAGLRVVFSAGMLALAPVVTAGWKTIQGIFSGYWTAITAVVRGALQAIHGVILVFGGIFKGDFGQIWNGIKTIFRGGITALKGILEGAWKVLKAPVDGIGAGLHDAFSHSWDRIKALFRDSVNVVIGFLNELIGALDKIPGVHIGRITPIGGGGGGGGGNPNIPVNKKARGGAYGRTGGYVNSPITLMGEEAPRHPEYVIPTNPAYRGQAQGLLAQAAGAIGMAQGGVWSKGDLVSLWKQVNDGLGDANLMAAIALAESGGRQSIVNSIGAGGLWQIYPPEPGYLDPQTNARIAGRKLRTQGLNAWVAYTNGSYKRYMGGRGIVGQALDALGGAPVISDILSAFPKVTDALGMFEGLGGYVLGKATDYAKAQVSKLASLFQGGPGKPQPGMPNMGPRGVGSFNGIPMANWVIESLKYAQSKGVDVRPTSGYRPGVDPHTATGRSEHQGTQYPHGAVDFGGYNTGGAMKMAVVNATAGFKYPLLAPIGFHDEGHASGTGHARGGVFSYLGSFRKGGVTDRAGMAYLHANEAILPLAKGGRHPKLPPARKKPRRVVIPTARHMPTMYGFKNPRDARGRVLRPRQLPRSFNDPVSVPAGAADDGSDANQALIDSNAQLQAAIDAAAAQQKIHDDLQAEANALARRMANLIDVQGPQMLAAVVAAVNGGIGGSTGLGFQTPSYPGGMARYK